jgi:hypothetical protein
MFNPADDLESQTDSDEPKTEAPEADPPTETGPTTLKCSVCGEVMESEEGAPSARCPLCGGVMRQEADELVVTERFEAPPGLEPEPEAKAETESEAESEPETETEEKGKEKEKEKAERPKDKPKKRRKKRRRRRRRPGRAPRRKGGPKDRRITRGEPLPPELRVGFGRRLLGLFLDGLIVGAVGSVLGLLLVTFYLKEMNEAFSYPADVKKVADIEAGRITLEDDALVDDDGFGEEDEDDEADETIPEGTELEEGAEEKETPKELVKPRLLFEGRLGQIIAVVLGMFFVLPFFGIVEMFTAASVGKKLLSMSVRADDGRLAPGNSLFARYMIKYGAGVAAVMAVMATAAVARALGDIILVIGALDGLFFIVCAFVALSRSKQGVHDQLCFTAVYPDVLPEEQPEE